jgi:ferredoxin/flavodoxin
MTGKSRVALLYFSGTGNTKIITHLLRDEFEENECDVNVFAIENVLSSPSRHALFDGIQKYEYVGMGYPIHALNAPRIFFDFIDVLPSVKSVHTFIFKCSADPFLTGGSTAMVRTRLQKKGYAVAYETLFIMPSNIFFRYQDSLIKQLYETAGEKARVMVREILDGIIRLQENHWISDILSRMFSMVERVGARYMGKDYTVSNDCTLCGLCIDNCPTENIYKKNDMIQFRNRCLFCLRCIYNCPQQAISPRLFKGLILKEGYDIDPIINDQTIKGNFINENTKGYYKRFKFYLKE